MATYLPGVQDYIPQTQPFKPDFNFYSNALSFRQAKYDAGYEQLNTVYSSMLNGPMSRSDNRDDREKFFKTINNDIQKMAGLDLSKSQNVVAAGNVFDQLLDNDYIAKDMAWTKNLQNQQRRGQALKNCTDPKKCGGEWWEGGDQQLQYKTFEFQNMSRDQSIQARNVEYVPFQNVQERAIELADKMDLNVSSIVQDDGKWVITQTNGSLIEGDLYNMFVGSLGQDPKIKQYNTAKAYNQRMGYSTSKMQEFGSLEAANNDYFLKMQEQMTSVAQAKEVQAEAKVRSSKRILDSKIKTAESEPNMYSPGLQGLIEELAQENELDTRNRDIHKQLSKTANAMKIVPNLEVKLGMLDELVGSSLFENEMRGAAHTLSKRNASVKREANPYGLANYKSNLRLKEAKIIAADKLKADQKLLGKDMSNYNTTSAEGLANGNPLEQNNKGNKFKVARDMAHSAEDRIKQEEVRSIKAFYKTVEAAARSGNDPQAEKQLVELGNTYMKHISGNQNRDTPGKQDLGDKDLAYWLENSMLFDSDELDAGFSNDIYNNIIKPSVESHQKNESNMSYLDKFVLGNQKIQSSIDANALMADEISRDVKKTIAKMRSEVMANGTINKEAFDMVYDEYGAKRDKDDFKKMYLDKDRILDMSRSALPGTDGGGFFGGMSRDFLRKYEDKLRSGKYESIKEKEYVEGVYSEYVKELSDEVDDFFANDIENLKFYEDEKNGDFDQFDMNDFDDDFESLYRKYDTSGVSDKMFDSGDDEAVGDLITGTIDSAYPLTDANNLVSQFVQESGANRATEYFVPEMEDGLLENRSNPLLAESFAKGIFADIQGNASKATSDNRAKYRFEYSPMLDGDEETQYLRVFPSLKYLKSMISSGDAKMVAEDDLMAIRDNGIVVSYPTSGSNTKFYNKSRQTPEDYILNKKSVLPINVNHQYYQNMNITENAKGYSVNGQYLAGINNDGTKAYRYYSQVYPKGTKVKALRDFYNNERLDKIRELYQNNVLAFDRYKQKR